MIVPVVREFRPDVTQIGAVLAKTASWLADSLLSRPERDEHIARRFAEAGIS